MSFGKMNTPITIIETKKVKDPDGFVVTTDVVVASVRAYREERHGSTFWANQAVWSKATSLFQFRVIPNLTITTAMKIGCGSEKFKIVSVENVRSRGMYIEVLAEKTSAT
ncbi:head-tail adaptor protein [Scatolibacter rhodanostii]|uniref:head-tail adaptor protein n=1 Tax=Scatolibacter rhodanostii TaxID=2014781 RepID=UPI000C0852D6|nr:head-tail adaptor protein [Scatolibacter rhodanostii]